MTSYLIIGNGRVATHFARYFSLESLPFKQWSRRESEGDTNLRELARDASHVLLLISDRSIEPFFNEHSFLNEKTCLHFSGSLVSGKIRGAHPLMTFSHEPYDLETYRRISFVLEKDRGTMAELLPGLSNPHVALDAAQKPLYHALCSMSGNFSVLLWERVFSEFENKLELPRSALRPYLERITMNLLGVKTGDSVLTGPLARNDRAVIDKHLSVLKGDPYEQVYRAFIAAFDQTHTVTTLKEFAKECK
jgi:hypothetical protein